MPDDSLIETLTRRVAAEFSECPGLRLTAAQAARLWAVDGATIDLVLDSLMRGGTIRRTREGAFTRAGERCANAGVAGL